MKTHISELKARRVYQKNTNTGSVVLSLLEFSMQLNELLSYRLTPLPFREGHHFEETH